MLRLIRALRKKYVIGVVGGSDLVKVTEQLTTPESVGAYPAVYCVACMLTC